MKIVIFLTFYFMIFICKCSNKKASLQGSCVIKYDSLTRGEIIVVVFYYLLSFILIIISALFINSKI